LSPSLVTFHAAIIDTSHGRYLEVKSPLELGCQVT